MFELVLTLARRRELRTGDAMRRSLLIYFFFWMNRRRAACPRSTRANRLDSAVRAKASITIVFFFLHSVRLHNTSGGIHKTQ